MGNLIIKCRKGNLENLQKQNPEAIIFDVTSKAYLLDPEELWRKIRTPSEEMRKLGVQLSPFYPHGRIPIPNSGGETAGCVEGVWQGLKIFEDGHICWKTLRNITGKNLKRSIRKNGPIKGHQYGTFKGSPILDYIEARFRIYLPTYRWMLEHIEAVKLVLNYIREELKTHDVILLDYNTNVDIYDCSRPLSHAGLIKLFIEGNYPNDKTDYDRYRYLVEERLQQKEKKSSESKEGRRSKSEEEKRSEKKGGRHSRSEEEKRSEKKGGRHSRLEGEKRSKKKGGGRSKKRDEALDPLVAGPSDELFSDKPDKGE